MSLLSKWTRTKDPKVVMLRLNSAQPNNTAEYILGTVEDRSPNGFILKNVLRHLQHYEKVHMAGVAPNGQPVPVIQTMPRYESFIEDYFTDFSGNFVESNVLYSRFLTSDESIYKSYVAAIDQHREAQARNEAAKILERKRVEAAALEAAQKLHKGTEATQ